MQIETVIFRLQEQHQYFYYQFLYGFSVIDILHTSSPHPLHLLPSPPTLSHVLNPQDRSTGQLFFESENFSMYFIINNCMFMIHV